MSITSPFGFESNDPKLEAFSETRNNPKVVICILDVKPTRSIDDVVIKRGQLVIIKGTVGNELGGFDVCVPDYCGFYDYTCFEIIE